ncbi:hypothetical protein BJ138DRAFT_1106223 [Hygrophoropsis aurantiaca]|uniref:Uncharacterized protein n=1 Tax=Hygrophoropsis aurantiaca TaxID=72124 RepID=A0ACB7ZVE4_9AGAM|nr:hypothetical protein BJ138DRAFT_1106223 [Hygrophoropsis aurantiaca]
MQSLENVAYGTWLAHGYSYRLVVLRYNVSINKIESNSIQNVTTKTGNWHDVINHVSTTLLVPPSLNGRAVNRPYNSHRKRNSDNPHLTIEQPSAQSGFGEICIQAAGINTLAGSLASLQQGLGDVDPSL